MNYLNLSGQNKLTKIIIVCSYVIYIAVSPTIWFSATKELRLVVYKYYKWEHIGNTALPLNLVVLSNSGFADCKAIE